MAESGYVQGRPGAYRRRSVIDMGRWHSRIVAKIALRA